MKEDDWLIIMLGDLSVPVLAYNPDLTKNTILLDIA